MEWLFQGLKLALEGSGGMTQQLKTLAAFSEDQVQLPALMWQLTAIFIIPVPRDLTPSSDCCMYLLPGHTYKQNKHKVIVNIKTKMSQR